MSFARFSDTDIYIFEHAAGFIQCCGCTLKSRLKPEEERIVEYLSRPKYSIFNDVGIDMVNLATPREALNHLEEHIKIGDNIGQAKQHILDIYPDLNVTIKPFTVEKQKKFWKVK